MTGTTIHPSAIVGPGVELGLGVSIGPYAVLTGPLQVGDRVFVGSGCAIGGPPEITSLRQNLAWAGDLEHAGVVIEADAVLRELVVVHQGSRRPTTIGAGSWLLNRSYLAHDVLLGAGATVSAGVSIGGHCEIRAGVNLGMNASVHQGRRIGAGAMVGMGATVARDVPPYAKVFGVPLRLHGVNVVGMRRAGLESAIPAVSAAYAAGRLEVAPAKLAEEFVEFGGSDQLVELTREFAWWASLGERRPVSSGSSGASAAPAR